MNNHKSESDGGGVQQALGTVSQTDLAVIAHQLGRAPRGVVGVAARCSCGTPLVVTTAPRLPDGTPFPTLYYLTHPGLSAAISRLEGAGAMRGLSGWLDTDQAVASAYQAAHQAYLASRATVGRQLGLDDVPEISGISAGGMPDRIKCLHALVAHSLAVGKGVNPIGDQVLTDLNWDTETFRCPGHQG